MALPIYPRPHPSSRRLWGSPHAVVCLPFTPDVRPIYDLLDVGRLPSRIEGLSQSLLEAMALGKPVIASAAAGNLDLMASRDVQPRADARFHRSLLEEAALAPPRGSR